MVVCLSFVASATVTIMIDDVNDHSPRFVQSVYSATMSESLTQGASIISVSATDRDIGSNAKLVYTLREQDREHFYISSIEATNTGVLKVFKVIVVSGSFTMSGHMYRNRKACCVHCCNIFFQLIHAVGWSSGRTTES